MAVRLVHYIMHKQNPSHYHVSNGAAWRHSRRQCAATGLACMWIDGMQCPSMKWKHAAAPRSFSCASMLHHNAQLWPASDRHFVGMS
jgi:hypothetical protein